MQEITFNKFQIVPHKTCLIVDFAIYAVADLFKGLMDFFGLLGTSKWWRAAGIE